MHLQEIAGLVYPEHVKYQISINLRFLWMTINYWLFQRQIHPFHFIMVFWIHFSIHVYFFSYYNAVSYANYSQNSSLSDEYSYTFKPCIHMYNRVPMISACYRNQIQYYSCSEPYRLMGECSLGDALLVHEEHSLYNKNASLITTNKGIAINRFFPVF